MAIQRRDLRSKLQSKKILVHLRLGKQISKRQQFLQSWGLLLYDRLYSGRLLNALVDEHQYGAIWGAVPLVPLDVFEHAYYHKDGPARAKFIDNFVADLHWGRINERYKKLVLGK